MLRQFWDAIWPNLAANVIWGAPALWLAYVKLRKSHKRVSETVIAEVKEHLMWQDEQLVQIKDGSNGIQGS